MNSLEWPEYPYKGLAFYSFQDRPIFSGRESDVRECSSLLAAQATRILVLHGRTGCGKSSFIRAGVIPHLLEHGHGLHVAPGTELSFEPLVIRSGAQPLLNLAEGVYDLVDRLGLEKELRYRLLQTISRDHFCQTRGTDAKKMFRFLEDLALSLPKTLVLIIDQSEEVFTLIERGNPVSYDYLDFLMLFSKFAIDVKLVISMRTEYKGIFDDELAKQSIDFHRVPGFYLSEMNSENMVQAIKHPTEGAALGRYKFTFEDGLPEKIGHRIWSARPQGGILPVLQVICQRLYDGTRPVEGCAWIITERDFLELGPIDSQIDNFLEARLLEAVEEKRISCDTDKVVEMDRWKELLCLLIGQETDGRVVTKKISEREMFQAAQKLECHDFGEISDLLSEPSYSILRKEAVVGGERELFWTLGHDAIGLSLNRLQGRGGELGLPDIAEQRDRLLAASGFEREDLFLGEDIDSLSLLTFNDLIWDHQFPLYADSKGFFKRLGFSLDVPEFFDIRKTGTVRYGDIADRGEPMLLSVPRELFNGPPFNEWIEIGVSNLFAGYALVGREMAGLKSLRTLNGPFLRSDRVEAFLNLAQKLCSPNIRVSVLEEASEFFVNFLASLAFRESPVEVCVNVGRVDKEGGEIVSASRDALYEMLIEDKADFVVGPATTRALAERAGFVIYLDAEDVFEIIGDIFEFDARERSNWRDRLANIYMHNVWLLNFRRDAYLELRPKVLRLAAALFFTTAFIRLFREDLVRFVYAETLEAQNSFPLDRFSIRRSIASCYKMFGFEEYGKIYLDRQSEFRHRYASSPGTAQYIYEEMTALRAKFWEHWYEIVRLESESSDDLAEPLLDEINQQKEAAWRNYYIYNFFDAERVALQICDRLAARRAAGRSALASA